LAHHAIDGGHTCIGATMVDGDGTRVCHVASVALTEIPSRLGAALFDTPR
jgi:hypothetical protein